MSLLEKTCCPGAQSQCEESFVSRVRSSIEQENDNSTWCTDTQFSSSSFLVSSTRNSEILFDQVAIRLVETACQEGSKHGRYSNVLGAYDVCGIRIDTVMLFECLESFLADGLLTRTSSIIISMKFVTHYTFKKVSKLSSCCFLPGDYSCMHQDQF